MPSEGTHPIYRIAIDYTAAARETAGIGRYARELVHAIMTGDPAHSYVLMTGMAGLGAAWDTEKTVLQHLLPQNRLQFRDLPLTDDWIARLWQRLRLPIPADWITGRADLFYSPNFVLPPLLPRTPSLLTVHDLSFMRYPETFPDKLHTYLTNVVPRSVDNATHIITDSEATRQDLIDLCGTDPEKITTLLLGVAPRFTSQPGPDERQQLRDRYAIGDRPYILAVGTVQPRKNYIRLMQALDPITGKLNIDLVIVGRPAWLSEPILQQAARRPYVHMLGFLDDNDLPAVYRQAELLTFPSLY
ncbi:MAG: glycosyltransferase family 1 protein, partial [Anaerolineae bacterium]|nr:glycosyltransferase family 1 protein [Anaerolineae bacterium]